MKRITICLGMLAILGTVAVIYQHRALSIRHHHQGRGFTNEMLNNPAPATNAALEEEIRALREQTRDLAKLRNEVGQLRGARTELAVARSESARLPEAKHNPTTTPALPPGFISRQQLANVGFATPEAAVQTFFWSLLNGEFETAMQTLAPSNPERKRFDKLSAEKRAALLSEMKSHGPDKLLANFNDFGVRLRENVSDDQVLLHIGSSLTTNTMRMSLQRVGTEWRLQDFP